MTYPQSYDRIMPFCFNWFSKFSVSWHRPDDEYGGDGDDDDEEYEDEKNDEDANNDSDDEDSKDEEMWRGRWRCDWGEQSGVSVLIFTFLSPDNWLSE